MHRLLTALASLAVGHRFEGTWAQWLQLPGSREYKFSSCGTRALLPCGMWGLPGPGIKPVSSALGGGFFTTELPGKPRVPCF